MRLPLATDLKARVGTPDKDARVKNGIVEVKGSAAVVRSRPGVSEALATNLGLYAQGGMAFGDYLVYLNNDVVFVFYNFGLHDAFRITDGVSLMWSSGGSYSIGDVVYDEEDDSPSYALVANPPFRPTDPTWGAILWSKTPPGSERWTGAAEQVGWHSGIGASKDSAGFMTIWACPYHSPSTAHPVSGLYWLFDHIGSGGPFQGRTDDLIFVWQSTNGSIAAVGYLTQTSF